MAWESSEVSRPSQSESLTPRHAGHHHTANIKYGHIVFAISIVHLMGIALGRYVYRKRWSSNGGAGASTKLARWPLLPQMVIWPIIILVIGFANVEELAENYKVVIKRFGRLSYCLLPFDVFLVLRPNVPLIQYLDMINLHKWMSRLIMACGFIHGIGYFVVWTIEGTLITKSLRLLNFWGVVVFFTSWLLLLISIKFIRSRIYQYFYIVHNITVWAFVYLISFHARPGVTIYTGIITLLLVYQIVARFGQSYKISNLTLIKNESSNLQVIRIPKPANFPTWSAGSHIRITYPASDYRAWVLPTHPYTIASLTDDNNIDLIVKAGQHFRIDPAATYALTGPFPAIVSEFYSTAENVVIVCGGSGVSFGIPIFNKLKQIQQDRSCLVKLVWCVRDMNDLYILKEMNLDAKLFDIYVTGNLTQQDAARQLSGGSSTLFDEESYGLLGANATDDIELQPIEGSQDRDKEQDQGGNNAQAHSTDNNLNQGRYDFNTMLDTFRLTDGNANKWIVTCGPETLVSDAARFGQAHGVKVITEVYAM